VRSDILYYDGMTSDRFVVAFHAQPHSITSLYTANRKDQVIYPAKDSLLALAYEERRPVGGFIGPGRDRSGAAYQEVLPVFDQDAVLIGELAIETARVEYESFKRRGRNSQKAMHMLKAMVARGDLRGAKGLSAFTASDGLLLVEPSMNVRHTNNIAQEIYGRVGVTQSITRQRLSALETGDEVLVAQAIEKRECVEREEHVRDAIWIRRAIPLIGPLPRGQRSPAWSTRSDMLPEPKAALLLIRDVTVQRRRQEDQARLETVSKEIHHRVKNNLQQIISLTRVVARRSQLPETKRALEELCNRIFAIAQVHEYLSAGNLDEIQLKDVSRQIAKQMRESLLPKESPIMIEVEGDPVKLEPRQATLCALIVNELVQNSVEHAFDDAGGIVRIQLEDSPERVRIAVVDNGRGLPPGFEWRHSPSLGLKIVHTLVQDLRAELKLRNQESPAHGLVAQVTLSKMLSKGK
jgi:two-component sensor histidine kinase